MISKGTLRSAFLGLAAAASIGCGAAGDATGPHTATPPLPNFVRLVSDGGDYVGAGRSYEYTQSNAILSVTASRGQVAVIVDGDESWRADFALPADSLRLRPGVYAGLTRYPFNAQKGGLDWSGEGRGCNTIAGSFTIDSVTYLADTLKALDLRFEQHCEGVGPALRGTVHWRSDDTTSVRGPTTTVPAGLWQPPAGVMPATGTAVYLQSDAGDFIGQGQTYLYTPGTSSIQVAASGGHLSVGVGGWAGDFQVMSSLETLKTGYYGGLERFPFHNPAKGGLSWYGNGRGCNTLTGWFVIDDAKYIAGVLKSIDLRFEQHCEGGASAIRGRVRWTG